MKKVYQMVLRCLGVIVLIGCFSGALWAQTPRADHVSGLPVPRYVSIKASEANARRGPSLSHRIDWVFVRRNLPVRVTAEFGHWRRVEDHEGAGGWIHRSLLSGVRTVVVIADLAEMRARPEADARLRARLERTRVAKIVECEIDWCLLDIEEYRGWVHKGALWGVDPDEELE